ncbi:hypothetical protein T439DRAFT_320967 [Meredithblackwellia eburnea MCA 4105]
MTSTLTPMHCGRDVFSHLPPELLAEIFRGYGTLLSPSATPVCRSLLPYTRLNAYKTLQVDSDVTLAALGQVLRGNPHLGPLVVNLEIKEDSRGSHETCWLMDSFAAALDALRDVETITIRRRDLSTLLLDERIMQTAAFQSAHTLVLSSPEPIPFSTLRYLHHAKGIKTVEIQTPMKYSPGDPSGVFEGNTCHVEKLIINAEPHSADFEAFFEYMTLSELNLRSGTADLDRIVQSLGESTRTTLRSFNFSTTSYLSHRLDTAFAGFASLEHLTVWSMQFEITPLFFSTLSVLPLKSVHFLGPHESSLLSDLIDFVGSGDCPETLTKVTVDLVVPRLQSAGPYDPQQERDLPIDYRFWRAGEDARVLSMVCRRRGITLSGSIRDALRFVTAFRR